MGHIAPCLRVIYVIVSGKSDMEIINCLAKSLQTLLLIFRLCNYIWPYNSVFYFSERSLGIEWQL